MTYQNSNQISDLMIPQPVARLVLLRIFVLISGLDLSEHQRFFPNLSLSLYQSPGLLLTGPLLKVAILSKNKQFQKKISKIQKQTFQTVNPTIQQETRNLKNKHKSPQIQRNGFWSEMNLSKTKLKYLELK